MKFVRLVACLPLVLLTLLVAVPHQTVVAATPRFNPAQRHFTPDEVRTAKAQNKAHFNPNQMLRLAIGLQPPNMAAEQQFLRDVQTKGSPLFHHFLTAAQWNERFAPSAADEQAVVTWLQGRGLTVTQRFANRLVVDVQGTSGQIEKAFNVHINSYQLGTKSFFSNDRDPAIPANLTGVVQSIVGMNNLANMHSMVKGPQGTTVSQSGPIYSAGPTSQTHATQQHNGSRGNGFKPHYISGGFDPPNLYSSEGYDVYGLYNISRCCNPDDTGGASDTPYQTNIAISTSGDFDPNDLAGFASGCCPETGATLAYHYTTKWIDGSVSCCNSETTLDVEESTAMSNSFGCYCDTAHVYAYETPTPSFTSFIDADNQILTDSFTNTFSTSWGLDEGDTNNSCGCLGTFDGIFSQMSGEGWTLFAAAGDSGAYDNGSSLSVDYPASDPNITGAGGTVLSQDGSENYLSETAWSGGGGGCSSWWSTPSYQVGTDQCNGARNVPDVSLNSPGYAIYLGGGWQAGWYGTSFVAPELAGLSAQFNSYLLYIETSTGCFSIQGHTPCVGFGNINPLLYAARSAFPHQSFYDITSGNNGFYNAGTGYDLATGLGSVNALQLARQVIWFAQGDTGAPVVTYSGPTTGTWYNSDRTVSFSIADTGGSATPVGVNGFSAEWDADPGDPVGEATPGCCNTYYSGPWSPLQSSGSLDLAAAGQGCHTANVRSWDNQGLGSGDVTYGTVCYDTVAPSTTASISGTGTGCSSKYFAPVTVTLHASDSSPGSGVASTVYQINGGTAQTYSGPFTVSTHQAYTITYHSSDHAGNVEATKTTTFTIGPKLTRTPSSGVYTTSISLTGSAFKAGEPVKVYWDSTSTTALLSTSATTSCGFTGSIHAPQATNGSHSIIAVGSTSGQSASASFKILASAPITPRSGARGSSATVKGTGFGAGETVTIAWKCSAASCASPTTLGTAVTSSTGSFTKTVTIPTGSTVGTTYSIRSQGGTTLAKAYTTYAVTS